MLWLRMTGTIFLCVNRAEAAGGRCVRACERVRTLNEISRSVSHFRSTRLLLDHFSVKNTRFLTSIENRKGTADLFKQYVFDHSLLLTPNPRKLRPQSQLPHCPPADPATFSSGSYPPYRSVLQLFDAAMELCRALTCIVQADSRTVC